MKKTFLYIIGLLIASQKTFAASIGSGDSIISPPAGRDVLPGGGLQSETIQESFVFSKILPFIIDYALRAAIVLAVLVLIFAGYQFMTAFGNTEKHEEARKTIIYALIGLILALTAYGIIQIITRIQLVT
ncbi:pilin [Patescibacteria group bacterium]|nr:pilin [Patescibacteria group bacterium]